jgi:hypothetical protein
MLHPAVEGASVTAWEVGPPNESELFMSTFRVVAFHADGSRILLHENLSRDIAEGIQATMSVVYPKVLVEPDNDPQIDARD